MPTAQFSFGNIDHVAIIVENMSRSVSFYKKCFGFEVERKFGNTELGIRAVVMKHGDSRIELFHYRDDKPGHAKNIGVLHGAKVPKSYFEPGIRHIAFRTRQFDGAVSFLRTKGLDPWIRPKTGYSGDSITFFEDPNGVMLEVVSPLGRRKKNKAKPRTARAKAKR